MKKLVLNKLTVTTLSENMMRAIHGGFADTYGDRCTNTCDTGNGTNQPTCTDTQVPTGPSGCDQCTTASANYQCDSADCSVTHCTNQGCATYNDDTCNSCNECTPNTFQCR